MTNQIGQRTGMTLAQIKDALKMWGLGWVEWDQQSLKDMRHDLSRLQAAK